MERMNDAHSAGVFVTWPDSDVSSLSPAVSALRTDAEGPNEAPLDETLAAGVAGAACVVPSA
eukprot:628864-Alexandrium_andersonii.AAC.1